MADIVEVKAVVTPISTVTNIVLDTVLVSSDVVFVVCHGYRFSLPSIAISGMTLSDPIASADTRLNNYLQVARWGTGATGSKTVAITQGTTQAGSAIAYVIRGLNSSTLDDFQLSTYDTSVVASRSTPSFLVEPGQVAIFSGLIETNRSGGAITATHPASGWQADTAEDFMLAYSHDSIASAGSTVGTVSASANGQRGVFGVLFGTADAAAPPLTSTFVGWGSPIF